jgi:Transposase DDE domain
VARDAERVLRAVEEEDGMIGDEAIAAAAALLREIVGQEFEVPDDEVPRVRRGRRTRQVVSAHDPDMRHGRKTAARPFTGYKLHAAAATEAPLLTSISVSLANEHDGQHAGTLIDQEPEERRPKRVIGDTAYGNIETREQLEARSIAVLAPVDTTSPKDGAIAKDAFAIDLEAGTVTCPRGETARMQRPDPRGERLARFSPKVCGSCLMRAQCAPGGQRAIRISRREDLRQAAMRALSDRDERERLYRVRPRIERLLGLIVHRYRGRKARYRGARKATLQAVWTAVLVNLHPIGAALRMEGA